MTDQVLVPFTGSQRDNPDKDAFDFFLSQLRIRIEMAFGLMTNKWQILQKEMITTLSTSAKVLEACARLHNFVIDMDRDEDLMDDDEIDSEIVPMAESPFAMGIPSSGRKIKTNSRNISD